MWSASYHVTEETSRFILSTGSFSDLGGQARSNVGALLILFRFITQLLKLPIVVRGIMSKEFSRERPTSVQNRKHACPSVTCAEQISGSAHEADTTPLAAR